MAPEVLIRGVHDAILPVGVPVARQMGWTAIPVPAMVAPPLGSDDGLCIYEDGAVETVRRSAALARGAPARGAARYCNASEEPNHARLQRR